MRLPTFALCDSFARIVMNCARRRGPMPHGVTKLLSSWYPRRRRKELRDKIASGGLASVARVPARPSSLLALAPSLLARVRPDVEVHEEGEEAADVEEVDVRHAPPRVHRAVADEERRLRHHHRELDQLHLRQVLLPPDVLRVHGQEVV